MARRFFNTAGPCRPELHYMLPAEQRVVGLRRLIDDQSYFVVHAPRQVGKTTSLRALAEALTAEARYAALHTSCEMGQKTVPDLDGSIQAILEGLTTFARRALDPELRPPEADRHTVPEARLFDLLTRWAEQSPRPVVLFLDEIDALYDDALISVLRQLRHGFQNRPKNFPQSIALIGLRDVRDYKIIARGEHETLGTASPFNIKSDSLRLPSFTAEEVAALLEQHTEDTGQAFAVDTKAATYELARGQPWLFNALARQLIDTVVPDRSREITTDHLLVAKEILIRRRDTHIDSLLDRLREKRVRSVLEPILAGELPEDEVLNDDVEFVKDLGLVALGETAENFVPMRRAAYVGEARNRFRREGIRGGRMNFTFERKIDGH